MTRGRITFIFTGAALAAGCGEHVSLGGTDAPPDQDGAAADAAAPDAEPRPARWSLFTSFDTRHPVAVWGASPDDVWAVGAQGTVQRWNGATWSPVAHPATTARLDAIWGRGADDIWAVGGVAAQQQPTALRWGGDAWAADATQADHLLSGIWGDAAGTAWAVGYAFNFHGYEPSPVDSWTRLQAIDAVYWPEDVWASPDTDDLWIVGNQGISRWRQSDHGFVERVDVSVALRAVWGRAGDDVWVVGRSGLVMHWDGAAWEPMESDTDADLHAVWASSADDAWAVGSGGAITHWDGAGWTALTTSPTDVDLFGIWGFAANDIWAVGHAGHGVFVRYAPE
jgi:hypothetical protein